MPCITHKKIARIHANTHGFAALSSGLIITLEFYIKNLKKNTNKESMKMSDLKKLTMSNFANGAATELFDRELASVLSNIDDINTKSDATREITLKFVIKPDGDREQAQLTVEAKSKLAPVKHASGQTYFGRTNGKLTAYAHNINQMELDVEQRPQMVEGNA